MRKLGPGRRKEKEKTRKKARGGEVETETPVIHAQPVEAD
jgi:hypothetical protein